MKSVLEKINFLITKRQRRLIILLAILVLVGMFLEAFGLGILIPGLSILLDPEMVEKSQFLSLLKDLTPDSYKEYFVILFLIGICILYFVKTVFLVVLSLKQNRFLNNITTSVNNNLFSTYLNQPYSFHLVRNSSELIKNLQVESSLFHSFISSLITIFTEFCFVLSIVLTIIYIEPLGAISIGLFYIILSLIFDNITRSRLNFWGILRQELDINLSKFAHEGLGAIKDLIILGKESYYINKYSSNNFLKSRIQANQGALTQFPRHFLEFMSIIGLIGFIIVQMLIKTDVKEMFTILGVFVAATFRIIPSINKIISASQVIKFNMPSVDIVFNEIKNFRNSKKINNNDINHYFQSVIEFKSVSFGYNKTNILNNISFKIKKGETIGIIGESGAGKSTLVDLLIGLHKPSSGKILIDDIEISELGQKWKNTIGYVSQNIYLIDDSIENNIALGVEQDQIDKSRIDQILIQVQLKKLVDSLELGKLTKVGDRGIQLSGGQKQRIGLARALYNKAEILILDEATSALDIETETRIMKTILNFKRIKTIIIVTHRLSTLKRVDSIFKLENKKLNKIR